MDEGKNPVEKLAYIVSQPKLCNVYEEFLVEAIAWENFGFLLDVERYQELETHGERKEMAKIIFDKFMEEDSLFTLGDVLPEVRDSIYNRLDDAPPKLFNSILRRTTMALAYSTMNEFEISDNYQQYLALEGQMKDVDLRFDHSYKLIMLGPAGAGKSCVLHRFTKHKFEADIKTTQGPEFSHKTVVVAQRAIKAQIWDTSGQEKVFSITKGYYRNCTGVVLVYDESSKDSFKNLDQWINEIKNWAPDVVVALLANKSDKTKQVTREEGAAYAQENNISLFFETSAQDGTNIQEAFSALLEEIYNKQKAIGGSEYQFEHSRITLYEEDNDAMDQGGCLCFR